MTPPPRLLAAGLLLAATAAVARPQPPEPKPLDLRGLTPAGGRVTEAWGALEFELANPNPDGREARVAAFYADRPDVQYARDVWVPGRSVRSSWLLVGPAPAAQRGAIPDARDMRSVLTDRTGGRERAVLPTGQDRVRSRGVLYRRREPTTALVLDEPDAGAADAPSEPDPGAEVRALARSLRESAGLSEFVTALPGRFLPPAPEAFDGIDVLIVAGNRVAEDPAGRRALRRWVERGGRAWVMLDRVEPATAAALLGDGFDVQPVDRVGLTTVRLHRAVDAASTAEPRELDEPVELVRVLLSGSDTPLYVCNGWPAAFARPLGRGQVLFTTLAARGWARPRTAADPRSRFDRYPDTPVALPALADLAVRLHPRNPEPTPDDALRDVLTGEVGYSVVGRGTAAVIFGGFLAAVVAAGVALRRSRRPELAGWLGPAAAVAVGAAFVALGQASRRAVPPTVAAAVIVEATPGGGEGAAHGLAAVFRPESGPVPLGSADGASVEIDQTDLEGRTRQRVVTDLDAWHWEGLNLPAGLRLGPLRSAAGGPIAAVARFGPNGLEGRLTTGAYHDAADAIVLTPTRQPAAVRFGPDGGFAVGSQDALPPGQFLTGAVLTDRQQRRQEAYRRLLGPSVPRTWQGRDLLLAWAQTDRLPFHAGPDDRAVGVALLAVPLGYERPPADSPVTVPAAFVPYARLLVGRSRAPVLEGSSAIEMELRFQLPPSVLPLTVERARLTAKVRTPDRRFTVSGRADGETVTVFDAENPIDAIRVEITDPRLLRPDADGGLRLVVRVGEQLHPAEEPPAGKAATAPGKAPFQGKGQFGGKGGPKGPPFGGKGPPSAAPAAQPDEAEPAAPIVTDLPWKIESLGLEVVGRTAAGR